jgi:RNA polymerase-binding transcription factor
MALTRSQVEHYRRILIARRSELAEGTARAESAVVDQDELEHLDTGDRATGDVAKEDLLQEAGRDSEQLAQIEAALAHITEGTYGICDDCGEEIPVSRLDAVPWALLCVRDQEISDKKRRADGLMSGGAPSRVVG